jgi:8-oxo-dGTP diphosphatase
MHKPREFARPAAMIGDRITLVVLIRRAAYRLAFALLRVWWFVRRPHLAGVKCVLLDGDQVLLVRHTYGSHCWELPGGSPKRGELMRDAARREIHEELGLTIDDWKPLGVLEATQYHRGDALHIFAARVHSPALTLDLGELAAAQWFPRDALPPDRGPNVQPVVARAAR